MFPGLSRERMKRDKKATHSLHISLYSNNKENLNFDPFDWDKKRQSEKKGKIHSYFPYSGASAAADARWC